MTGSTHSSKLLLRGVSAFVLLGAFASITRAQSETLDLSTDQIDLRRMQIIDRVDESVVAIFDARIPAGGGSGVIIHPDGYGLTNFHVIASMSATDWKGYGGLNDGRLYPLEVIGIDVGGDVALFKLFGPEPFASASLGDSQKVRVGQPVIALGNPFTLAEDFTPTATYGYVSGVQRYQAGEGNALEYADCIQVSSSINPGNSGGPLFDLEGNVIGINGRASFNIEDMQEGRGRVNVGIGYAISINQVKRFLPCLFAGQACQHGTLGMTVRDLDGSVVVDALQEDSPAARVGLRLGDRLLRVADRSIRTANDFNNVLATRPAEWPTEIQFQRGEETRRTTALLEPLRIRNAPNWTPKTPYQLELGNRWFAASPFEEPQRMSSMMGGSDIMIRGRLHLQHAQRPLEFDLRFHDPSGKRTATEIALARAPQTPNAVPNPDAAPDAEVVPNTNLGHAANTARRDDSLPEDPILTEWKLLVAPLLAASYAQSGIDQLGPATLINRVPVLRFSAELDDGTAHYFVDPRSAGLLAMGLESADSFGLWLPYDGPNESNLPRNRWERRVAPLTSAPADRLRAMLTAQLQPQAARIELDHYSVSRFLDFEVDPTLPQPDGVDADPINPETQEQP